ncbi:hypothetical protein DPX16_6150 [Anabarilius grahami]|uniref:Uncharacterized protein n=1 Tax=Anabarilius grahami TaxID=495550 RepID=A0A3N0Z1P9_ANAGA|nr:hypothetical protein DPX16_6150 [Anabarilius grahami]
MAALMWVKGTPVSGLSRSDRRSALPQGLHDPHGCQKRTGGFQEPHCYLQPPLTSQNIRKCHFHLTRLHHAQVEKTGVLVLC